MPKVAILFNDDSGLVRGRPEDQLAVQGVREALKGVERACTESGWPHRAIAVQRDPALWLSEIDRFAADVVFNLVEAVEGESRWEAAVAWTLELKRIPYTGSPPIAITLGQDKAVAKAVLRERGVAVPEGCLLTTPSDAIKLRRFPWIVKPARMDASHGITLASVVHSESAARTQVRDLMATYGDAVLVEEFLAGREFNVGLLGEGESAEVLPLTEIDYSTFPKGQARLITYNAKWLPNSEECIGSTPVPAEDLSADLRRLLASTARAAYATLHLRDYGRVDLRLGDDGLPRVLEVNPNPDLSPDAGLAKAANRRGLNHVELIARIVQAALARRAASSS